MDFNISTPTGDRTVTIGLPPLHFGVMVSGGFDSSLMLALVLMTRRHQRIKAPFTAYNVRRGSGTEQFSKEMVQMLADRFGTSIDFEYLDLPPDTHHHVQVKHPIAKLMEQGKVLVTMLADTQNPPIETPGWLAPDRLPVADQFKYKRWSWPFIHMDKTHTIALVRQLDLTFIETHSHTCTQQDSGRCGKCFQCQERAWGYRTLGLTDPGEH